MKLVIVESPSKAHTIEKYLGKEYKVLSSIGHVRDLPKSNKKAVDIEGGFIPHYEVSAGKQKVIEGLQKYAEKADHVLLATDPDREGEAIAWHVGELLTQDKKVKAPIERVSFHEITEEAVKEAIAHPRPIDQDLRKAQEARRVLDRLVGYDLSGLIWKKVRYGLSAGRVQSPALRILMEREREIRAFIPETYYTITGDFGIKDQGSRIKNLVLVCDKEPKEKPEAEKIIALGEKNPWTVVDIKETNMKRAARPPFTTSTLQQTASTRLGFSPSRTMKAAQRLYEAGFITYMRTDSTTISKQAQGQILAFVEKEYGKEYVSPTHYKTKSKGAQEAHEAIRPTNAFTRSAGANQEQHELYQLIWERAISSQMTAAEVLKTKISANIKGGTIPNFSTNGSRVLFPGWLSVDTRSRGDDVEVPKLKIGDPLALEKLSMEEKATTPPPRYSEAGLIKELEKRGIGRPSTYASIMQTLQDREYVIKEGRTLIPTDTGDVVSSFLEEHFMQYISDTFTAEMEDNLDGIAEGKKEYAKTLKDFYGPFLKDVQAKENIEKLTTLGEANPNFKCPKCGASLQIKLGRTGKFLSCSKYPDCDGALTIEGKEISSSGKSLGKDPKTGEEIFVLDGRFGPYVQIGVAPKKEKGKKKKKGDPELPKPKRASLTPGMKSENVTLEQAIKLLELPRTLGTYPSSNEEVIANIGRFGPYIGVGREFRSIKKTSGLDPYTITLEEAVKLLSEPKALPKGVKIAKDLGKHPKTGKSIQVLESKSGKFLKKGLRRIYLPDNIDIDKFTIEDAAALMQAEK